MTPSQIVLLPVFEIIVNQFSQTDTEDLLAGFDVFVDL